MAVPQNVIAIYRARICYSRVIPPCSDLRQAGLMPDAPQWDGKLHRPDAPQWDGRVYRPAKPGEGFRWDTADGAQRRAQIARQRRRYAQEEGERANARDADELDRLQWAVTPWPARVIVHIVE